MSLRKVIGGNVAQFRKSRDLNQAQLASILKVNKQTVYRIEAGTTNVGVDTLAALAKALGVEPALLMLTNSAGRGGRHDKRFDQMIDLMRKALHLAQSYKTTYQS